MTEIIPWILGLLSRLTGWFWLAGSKIELLPDSGEVGRGVAETLESGEVPLEV